MRTTRCRSRKSARGACDAGLVSMGASFAAPSAPVGRGGCAQALASWAISACVRACTRAWLYPPQETAATKLTGAVRAVARRYDSHKDQILRGGTCENIFVRERDRGAGKARGGVWRRRRCGRGCGCGAEEGTNAGRPDEEVNLWPFFNPSAFSGYGAGKKGFYGVYGELFATLARQVRDSSLAPAHDRSTCGTFPVCVCCRKSMRAHRRPHDACDARNVPATSGSANPRSPLPSGHALRCQSTMRCQTRVEARRLDAQEGGY